MTFVERFGNTMMAIFETVFMNIMYYPRQAELYRAAFPNAKKDFDQIMRNGVSMVLLNSHFTLSHTRPYLPNMVEVGGMHIKRTPDPLPADIKAFLDNATEGVVYFSLGSNIRSTLLPAEKRDAILKTFAKLKQKVMWKWEDENLPGKPDNVFVKKWWPQDDILAHPNVKVFITHGGLLSTSEAIYHGVPVIGVPFFGDQDLNMAKATRAGYGVTVRYTNLTEKALSWALNEVLGSPSFAENIKGISKRFRDQPALPLDTAVYWAEYVIRHKGAPHLQSAGQELTFYQYHNLDVFGMMLAIVVFMYYALKMCWCGGGTKKPVKTSATKKRN
jgi:UDP:flavonoid glycosyltransferase YjiC (YdhE family)